MLSLVADVVLGLGVAFFAWSTTIQVVRLRRRVRRLERRTWHLVVLEAERDAADARERSS